MHALTCALVAVSPSLNYFYGQVNNSITQALNSVPITMAHNIGPMLQNVRLDRNDFRALMSKNDVMVSRFYAATLPF